MNDMHVHYGKDCDIVLIEYTIDKELGDDYGAPRILRVKYTFSKLSDTFDYELCWFDKDANRIPEALWLNFNFSFKQLENWKMKKINHYMPLTDIVFNGNRNMSAVEELKYEDSDGCFTIKNLHAPLFSLGKGKLLQFDNEFASIHEGLSFNLYNNVWGTNFPMWYEDDTKFVFEFAYRIK